jgi:hypothetical protein
MSLEHRDLILYILPGIKLVSIAESIMNAGF